MLASAFLDEADEAGSGPLRSHKLLSHTRRLAKTGKESNPALLEQNGLQADCKLSFLDIGLKCQHPTLSMRSFLQMVAREDRLDLLAGGKELHHACLLFWERFRCTQADHPVYETHKGRLDKAVPCALYADEGQSFKRNPSSF